MAKNATKPLTWGLGFERELTLVREQDYGLPAEWDDMVWEVRRSVAKSGTKQPYRAMVDVINTNDYVVPCVEITSREWLDASFGDITDAVFEGTRQVLAHGNATSNSRQQRLRMAPFFRRHTDGEFNHAGSQHYWLTLPHPVGEKPNNAEHITLARVIQWLEPLLAGLVTEPHPASGLACHTLGRTRASVRGLQNVTSGWGTLDTSCVDPSKLIRRLRRLGFSRQEISFMLVFHSDTHGAMFNTDDRRHPPAIVNMSNVRRGTYKFKMIPRNVYDRVKELHPDLVPKHGADLRFGSILSHDDSRTRSRGLEVRVCDLISDAHSTRFFAVLGLVGMFVQACKVSLERVPIPQESTAWNRAMAASLKFGWSAEMPRAYLTALARVFGGDTAVWPASRAPKQCMEDVVARMRAAVRAEKDRAEPHPWQPELIGRAFRKRLDVPDANFEGWLRSVDATEAYPALEATGWLADPPSDPQDVKDWVDHHLLAGCATRSADARADLFRQCHWLVYGALPDADEA
jgi:hypothetical protein